MRRFYFQRDTDVSGTSGEGRVVDGVQFRDGTVVIRWLTEYSSTTVWRSIEEAEFIHGHGDATRVVWIDAEHEPEGDLEQAVAGFAAYEPPPSPAQVVAAYFHELSGLGVPRELAEDLARDLGEEINAGRVPAGGRS